MSCVTLTKSRKLACTSKIAGVVAIGIAPYDSLNRVVTTAISAGKLEVSSLNVTGTVTTAGNVTVTLDGVVTNIAVALSDTGSVVAGKIRATAFAGWTTSGTGANVVFTANAVGTKADSVYSAGATGATGAISTTVQGEAISSGGVVVLPTGMAAGSIARLELKNTATKYLENGVSGGDNRSTGVTGSIACTFNVPAGADIADTLMIEELFKGEAVLFIEKKDGTIVVAGSQLGALVITADGDTGGTIGDLNGYTVTFQTMEPDFSRKYLLTGAGLTAYATALMPYV